jgi:hypothetical protein
MRKVLLLAVLLAAVGALVPGIARAQDLPGSYFYLPQGGVVRVYTAGAQVYAGQPVVLSSSLHVTPSVTSNITGVLGVATTSAASGQTVRVELLGDVQASVDGTCAVGNFVVNSSTTNGNLHCQSATPTQQVIGVAGSAGTSSVFVQINPMTSSASGGVAGSGCIPPGSTANAILFDAGSGTCSDVPDFIFSTPHTLQVGAAGIINIVAGGTISGLTAGMIPTLNQNTTGKAGGLTGCTTTSTPGSICYWNGSAWVYFPGNTSGTNSFTESASGVPSWAAGGGGSMTWPSGGAGIPNYNGSSAWGTSYSASNTIPANFIPTLNQNTTGQSNTTVAFAVAGTPCSGQVAAGVDASGNAVGCQSVATNPMTAAGQLIQGGGSGAPTAVAANATTTPETLNCLSSNCALSPQGVNVDPQTGAYTLACPSDRLGETEFNISSATTVTVPQAGGTACLQSNAAFWVRNSQSSTFVLTIANQTTSCSGTCSLFEPEASVSKGIMPGSAVLVLSDAVSGIGNYHIIEVPAAWHGVTAKTAAYSVTAADNNELIVMNCSSACALTMLATPPDKKWNVGVLSIGPTLATVAFGGTNFNGSATPPVLVTGQALTINTDATSYYGSVPTASGSGTVTTTGSPTTGNPGCFTGSTVIGNCNAHMIVTPRACSDTSGSGSAQSCTTAPSFTPATKDEIIYSTTTTNTGDVTVNVNSTSAVHIRKWSGSAVLAAGDLVANVPVHLVYDGTYWEIGTIGNAPGAGSGATTTHLFFTGATNYTNATTSPTTPASGFSFAPAASTNYTEVCTVYYESSVSTAEVVVGTSGISGLSGSNQYALSVMAFTATGTSTWGRSLVNLTDSSTSTITGAGSAPTSAFQTLIVTLALQNASSTGAVAITFAASTTGTITVATGSGCIVTN